MNSTLTSTERDAMLGWILDCWEDAPDDLTDEEIVTHVDRHCDGCVEQFLLNDLLALDVDTARARALELRGRDRSVCLMLTLADGTVYSEVRPAMPSTWKSYLMHKMPYGTDFSAGVTFAREALAS